MLSNEKFINHFKNTHRLAILGFGQEGQSTYRTIRKFLPGLTIHICDQNTGLGIQYQEVFKKDPLTICFFGPDYLSGLKETDTIIKSPGIPFRILDSKIFSAEITSQTELFIRMFSQQIIGITGTKGKSTTSSLLHHIYQHAEIPSILVGNIGIPPFDFIAEITDNTRIIYEMSSHQLEHIHFSPHIAILLNIYQEHLDHYPSFGHYIQAKLNIARWQTGRDLFIYNSENVHIKKAVDASDNKARKIHLGHKVNQENSIYFEGNDLAVAVHNKYSIIKQLAIKSRLRGTHNLINLAAAASVAWLDGINSEKINNAVESFHGLPHRLEFAGTYKNVTFYNDSISTIPESTIAAIESFPQTKAIILGGFDRGVDYRQLIDFIGQSKIQSVVFTGDAGKRMLNLTRNHDFYSNKLCLFSEGFEEAFSLAVDACNEEGICLLSPAAASYNAFKDFKERGDRFKQLVQELYKPI
jgi:UDP-N-acetylmuramoyl-L-alanine---L-glutamate ligase